MEKSKKRRLQGVLPETVWQIIMLKIAITGSTGLVGSRIVELLSGQFIFIPLKQAYLDITNQEQVKTALAQTDYDIFLHLAAYTHVDKAEQEKDAAYKLNVDATRYLYETVNGQKKQFVYMSTDFVFDGIQPPYTEESTPNPVSVYGKTKFLGEEIVKDNAMIIRIAYPYRAAFEPKKDFVRSLKYYLEQGNTLTMVKDSTFTPTFIDDIAYGLQYLLTNFSNEIFHLVGTQTLSPYESALMIAENFGLDKSLIEAVTYDEYFKGKAQRPRYSEIKSSKNNFFKMSSFEEGLKKLK